MLSADLVLKGLGGLAVVGGATTVGVCYQQEKWIFAKKKVETLTLEELAGKVGLSCKGTSNTEPTATAGVECSKKTDANVKVKVKRDSDSFDVSNLPATGGSGGKLKVYKTSTGETYNNDFKFVIEEADISGEGTDKKLEEFETYEIKKEGEDDWRLTRKDKASVLKGKLLGLSGISNCKLPEDGNETTCSNLTAEDLKKIKFDGKTEGSEVTINDSGADNNISLKISKATTDEATQFPLGYKFVLETNKNISFPKTGGTINIKKGTNTEFKIKATPKSGSPKTLTLEKAWSLNDLATKLGLSGCASSSTTPKECTFTTSTKVNLFIDGDNHTKQATLKSADASKKIKVEEDQEGHNQGFKFFTEEENGISLESGTPTGTVDKKIEKKDTNNNSPTYEIKQQTVGDSGTKDWYLSKVTTAK